MKNIVKRPKSGDEDEQVKRQKQEDYVAKQKGEVAKVLDIEHPTSAEA